MTGVISAAFSRTGAVFVALLVLCGFGYVSYCLLYTSDAADE